LGNFVPKNDFGGLPSSRLLATLAVKGLNVKIQLFTRIAKCHTNIVELWKPMFDFFNMFLRFACEFPISCNLDIDFFCRNIFNLFSVLFWVNKTHYFSTYKFKTHLRNHATKY
jgi:hypothetical protein